MYEINTPVRVVGRGDLGIGKIVNVGPDLGANTLYRVRFESVMHIEGCISEKNFYDHQIYRAFFRRTLGTCDACGEPAGVCTCQPHGEVEAILEEEDRRPSSLGVALSLAVVIGAFVIGILCGASL